MPYSRRSNKGRRFCTTALIQDVYPLPVIMPDQVFSSQDDLRIWLQNTATVTGIATQIGRRLNQYTTIIANSPTAGRQFSSKSHRRRWTIDATMTPATIRTCREFINWSEGYPKLAGGILLAPGFGLDVREFIDEHTRWGKETPVIAIQYILLREPGCGELSALLRPVAGFTALQDTLASGRREFWGAVSSALARQGVTEHALSILERNESLRIRIRMQRYATINVSASIRYRRLVVAVVVPNSQQAGPANLAAIAGRLRLPGLPPPQHIKMPQCDGYYFNLTEQQLANNEVPSCEPETVAEKLIELKQLTEAIFTDQPPA